MEPSSVAKFNLFNGFLNRFIRSRALNQKKKFGGILDSLNSGSPTVFGVSRVAYGFDQSQENRLPSDAHRHHSLAAVVRFSHVNKGLSK